MLVEPKMDPLLCKELAFQQDHIQVLNDIIVAQNRLIDAYRDHIDLLKEEIVDILRDP